MAGRDREASTTRRGFLRDGAIQCARALGAGGLWTAIWDSGALLAAQEQAGKKPARPRRILVWSEGTAPKAIYPHDINGAVAEGLARLRGWEVRTAGLDDPDQGVGQAALDETDVLFWWGHQRHGQVSDAAVARIVQRVREGGMGFIALHSSHYAKPFKAVLPADGSWSSYVNDGKPHRILVADKKHPIARGVRDFVIPREERYEEPFQVPPPEAVVLDGVHEANGNHARQLLTWTAGKGRVVYVRFGHEEFPVYFQPEVRRILRNAALWAGRDEAGIAEDNDPGGVAARATNEPPLVEMLARLGYGGTDVTAAGEIKTAHFVKAGAGPVTFRPLAAYGLIKVCAAGWYAPVFAGRAAAAPRRTALWKVDAANNKRDTPPLMRGAKTSFDPGSKPFGLWVATDGFPGETVYLDDALQAFLPRFKENHHKAHVYAAVKSDGTPVPNAYVVGWEYSTNDDNQDIVTLVGNVRPAGG